MEVVNRNQSELQACASIELITPNMDTKVMIFPADLVKQNQDTHIDVILNKMQAVSGLFYASVYEMDWKEGYQGTAWTGASIRCYDSAAEFAMGCLKRYPLPAAIDDDTTWKRGIGTFIEFNDSDTVIEIYIDDDMGNYIRMYSEEKYQEVKKIILDYNETKRKNSENSKREREEEQVELPASKKLDIKSD